MGKDTLTPPEGFVLEESLAPPEGFVLEDIPGRRDITQQTPTWNKPYDDLMTGVLEIQEFPGWPLTGVLDKDIAAKAGSAMYYHYETGIPPDQAYDLVAQLGALHYDEEMPAATLWGRVKRSYQGGKAQTQAADLGYEAWTQLLRDPDAYEKSVLQIEKLLSKISPDYWQEERSFVERMLQESANVTPFALEAVKAAPVPAVIGGVVGGLGALVAGATVGALLPEEAVTVPAGITTGIKWGATLGAAKRVAEVETGLQLISLMQMKDKYGNKIDPKIAFAASGGVGLINGAIEAAEIATLASTLGIGTKVFENAAQKVTTRLLAEGTLNQIVAKYVLKYGYTLGAETGQELVQEGVAITGDYLAVEINNLMKGTEFKPATGKEIADRLLETAEKSAMAFAPVVGVGVGGGAFIQALTGKEKETGKAETAPAPPTVEKLAPKPPEAVTEAVKPENVVSDEEYAAIKARIEAKKPPGVAQGVEPPPGAAVPTPPGAIAAEKALAGAEGKQIPSPTLKALSPVAKNKEINKLISLDEARLQSLITPQGDIWRVSIKDFAGEMQQVGDFKTLKEARAAILPAHEKQLAGLRASRQAPAPEGKVTRKATQAVVDEIEKNGVYQTALESQEIQGQQIKYGTYYVPKQFAGEVKAAIGNYPVLKFHITHDPTKGMDWAKAVQEGFEGRTGGTAADIDIGEFLRLVAQSWKTGKKIGKLNSNALNAMQSSGDLGSELLAAKYEMMRDGLSADEINESLVAIADEYGVIQTDIGDILVKETDYVGKKQKVVGGVAEEKGTVETKKAERDKDLLGRPMLQGGAAGKQTVAWSAEDYKVLAERERINALADVEGQKKFPDTGKLPGGRQAGGTILLSPQEWADAITAGYYHLQHGATAIADWTAKMIALYGDDIKVDLPAIWDEIHGVKKVEEKPPEKAKRKKSKLTRRLEKRLKQKFAEAPGYEGMNMAKEAAKFEKEYEKDPDYLWRVMKEGAEPPNGLRVGTIYTGLELIAAKEGNVDALRDLAVVSTVTTASEFGQQVKAFDVPIENSPVRAMQEVAAVREKAVSKEMNVKSTTAIQTKMVKEMNGEMKKQGSQKSMEKLKQFIRELQC